MPDAASLSRRSQDKTARSAAGLMIHLLLATLALVIVVYAFDPWVQQNDQWLYLSLLNAAPLLLPWLLAAAIMRRVWPATIAVGFLAWLLFTINDIKLLELNQPLGLTDILLLPQVFDNAHLLGLYSQPLLAFGVGFAAALAAALAFWLEPARGGWKTSIALLVVGLVLAFSFSSGPVNRVFAENGVMDTPWSPIESIEDSGLMASLAASAGRDVVSLPKPDGARLAAIREHLSRAQQVAPISVPGEQRPDIIVVLSESFFDPGILDGIDTCLYLPDWCALRSAGYSGQMSVPTYGGNTTRTEFEVLTGVPYSLLPAGTYPYTSVVRRPMAALPNWLKLLGYETTAIHPHKRTFWQRQRAYPLLGFERFISEEDMVSYTRKGWFISDRDMTSLILEQLDSSKDAPQFIFAISMENHGPWDKPRPNMDQQRLEQIPVPEALPEAAALTWRQYVYHARNALEELNRLVEYVEQRQRPAMILFFGDHLPGLASIYEALPFRDGQDALAQETPYLILGGSGSASQEWKVRQTFQLPVRLLEMSRLPLPIHYRQLAQAYRFGVEFLPEGGPESLQISLLQTPLSSWQAASLDHRADSLTAGTKEDAADQDVLAAPP